MGPIPTRSIFLNTNHPNLLNPKIICEYEGGSRSYGLNTPESDIDLRGTYLVEKIDQIINPGNNSGYAVLNTNPESGEDKVYYEIRHMLNLLRKANTQSIEMLFNTKWTKITPMFEQIIYHRNKLIDPKTVNASINGYAFSEYKLAIGERTGKLGGKRHSQVDKYGFLPKNFTNLFRLLYSAETFYATGQFPVNLTGTCIHPQLMEIKTHPERFTLKRLDEMHDERRLAHDASWRKHSKNICEQYIYNPEMAAYLMLEAYKDTIFDLSEYPLGMRLMKKLCR